MKTLLTFILALTLTNFAFAITGENMVDCGYDTSEIVKTSSTIDIADTPAQSIGQTVK